MRINSVHTIRAAELNCAVCDLSHFFLALFCRDANDGEREERVAGATGGRLKFIHGISKLPPQKALARQGVSPEREKNSFGAQNSVCIYLSAPTIIEKYCVFFGRQSVLCPAGATVKFWFGLFLSLYTAFCHAEKRRAQPESKSALVFNSFQ